MYRCCMFDLDGTLLDTIHALAYTTNLVLKRLGLGTVDEEHLKHFVGCLLYTSPSPRDA